MKRFLIFLILSYLNGQNDQLFIGTRPLSMGGAFIAVADDANTITWNPAGLPGLRRTEFTSTYSDLYAMGITCLLYTSPSPRDQRGSRMPSSA